MAITVKNDTASKITVSINKWGDSGQTSPFSIAAGASDSWDRTDSRGFVMNLEESGILDGLYYVRAGVTVTFKADNSVENAIKIK